MPLHNHYEISTQHVSIRPYAVETSIEKKDILQRIPGRLTSTSGLEGMYLHDNRQVYKV